MELTSSTVDVGVVCEDFDASLDFYHRKLGFPVAQDLEIGADLAVGSGLAPGGFRHVRLKAGGALIKLMQIDPPPTPDPGGFHAGVRWLTLFLSDLEDTVQTLTSRGVRFLGPILQGKAGSFACAQAPDGVIVELVQLYSMPEPTRDDAQ